METHRHCIPDLIAKSLPDASLSLLSNILLGFTFNNLQIGADLLCYQAVVAVSPGDLASVGSSVRDLQAQDEERHISWDILWDADSVPVLRQEDVVTRAIPPKDGA